MQGAQLDTSDNINLSSEDTKQLKNLLLWCYDQEHPVTKTELLDQIKNDL